MRKQIVFNGRELVYHTEGRGEPVFLIHGFGEGSDVWQQQLHFLKDEYLVVRPELPGTGDSAIQEDMSMEGLAEALRAIVDAEELDRFVMFGHSMGGYVLLAFAEKYESRLEAFGLLHSSAFADGEEKKATRRKGIEFIRQHGTHAFLKNTSPNLFSPRSTDEKPELIDGFIAGLSNFSPEALVLYYEAMMKRPDRTHILKNTKLRVIFILGESDTAIPLSDGLKLCHMPEIAYIEILSNSGHMGMLEEPEKMNRALANFLKDV